MKFVAFLQYVHEYIFSLCMNAILEDIHALFMLSPFVEDKRTLKKTLNLIVSYHSISNRMSNSKAIKMKRFKFCYDSSYDL